MPEAYLVLKLWIWVNKRSFLSLNLTAPYPWIPSLMILLLENMNNFRQLKKYPSYQISEFHDHYSSWTEGQNEGQLVISLHVTHRGLTVLFFSNAGTKFSLIFGSKEWFSKTEIEMPISSFQKELENSATFPNLLKAHSGNSANFCVNLNPFIDQWQQLREFFVFFLGFFVCLLISWVNSKWKICLAH